MRFPALRLRLLLSCLMLLVAVAATGCARKSRERSLPPSIRTVSVPIFVNRSAEPAIEEDATIYTQEQFLADGRLDLKENAQADAVINVTITDYQSGSQGFDSDDFPRTVRHTVTARVEIIQNIPGRPSYGGPRLVTVSRSFNNDKRRITFEPEPWGKERVLRELARKIVEEVITGKLTGNPA